MNQAEEANRHRAEIALRNRRRGLQAREHKLSLAVFGLMAFLAFWAAFVALNAFRTVPMGAGVCLLLSALYSLGVYRVWIKDDMRWWPVAVPAGTAIAILLYTWQSGEPAPILLLLNASLLILVPLRRRAAAAASGGAPTPNPLRDSLWSRR